MLSNIQTYARTVTKLSDHDDSSID
uniref:Uncharacterized protein n=1 Tax=Caenorhabditis japonica TaxID=281687 RepID=A0A8R1ERH1_CAEJA